MKLTSHLEGNKSSQLINILLHLITNTTDANSLLTAEGQVGYNIDLRRIIYRTNSVIRQLLHNGDLFVGDLNDFSNVSSMTNLLSEAAATATALNNLRTEMLTAINNSAIVTEDFDAATATQFPTGATLNKRYRVTTAGTVQGVILAFGDLFYPGITNASPTNTTHWIFVQGNVDAANDTTFGLVKLAPKEVFADMPTLQAQMAATPNAATNLWHLQQLWYNAITEIYKNGAIIYQNINIGPNTVTHNLGGPDVMVQVQDSVGNTLLIDFQSQGNAAITFNSIASFANAKFTFWKPVNTIALVNPT